MDSVTLPLAFAAGIVTFASPCFLPIIPVFLTYLAGKYTPEASARGSRRTRCSRWRGLHPSAGSVAGGARYLVGDRGEWFRRGLWFAPYCCFGPVHAAAGTHSCARVFRSIHPDLCGVVGGDLCGGLGGRRSARTNAHRGTNRPDPSRAVRGADRQVSAFGSGPGASGRLPLGSRP